MGSGWGVRTAHAAVSGALALTLFVHRTELRERGEPLRALGFVALVLGSVLLHWTVSLMDPGFVPQAGVSEEQEAMIPPLPKTVQLRRCGYCMVKQPMRAKHCRVCQHCVRRFDHHCPWIENCVGEKNHSLFVAYLAVQLVVLLWALHIAWSGLYFEGSWKWLKHNIFLLLSFVLMAIFTVVVVLLLASHLYLVSCNTTTWEFMSRHRISYLRHCETENPFDQGLIRNLWRFFCTCHLVAWEKMYFQEDSDPV